MKEEPIQEEPIQDREKQLRQYIELKKKQREIEAQIEALKSNIFYLISQLQDETGQKEIAFEDYIFTLGYRRNYEYPQRVKDLEEELKRAKREAENSGEAKLISETGYVSLKKK